MTSQCNEAQIEVTSRVHTAGGSNGHEVQAPSNEKLDGVLRALEIPFDASLVQWRITEWSDDSTRGLMMPYADPRAYSDRLNSLLTPAGWTRKYSVQASAPVQRSKRGPAAKILVTCEVTLTCIGTNSGTGEEWSDKENALTLPQIFDSLGEVRSREGERARDSRAEVPNGLAHEPRLVPAFNDPPDADLHLIAK